MTLNPNPSNNPNPPDLRSQSDQPYADCKRCAKVGRNPPNKRDRTGHAYCRECRAEYARNRYANTNNTSRRPNQFGLVTAIKAAIDLLRLNDSEGALLELEGALQGLTRDTEGHRRGPNKQTLEELLRELQIVEHFEKWSMAKAKRNEIKELFPEYDLATNNPDPRQEQDAP